MKSDLVHCEVCKKKFIIYKYKTKNLLHTISGKPIPKKQLPEHKCKGDK